MDITGALLIGVVVVVVGLVFTRTWGWFFVALCLAAVLVLADMIAIGEDPRYPGTYLTLAVFQQIVLPGVLLLVGLVAAVKALFLRRHLRRLAQQHSPVGPGWRPPSFSSAKGRRGATRR